MPSRGASSCGIAAFALAAVSAAETRLDAASAVSVAGEQRMLSQRMVKAYLMLGQGIGTDDARAILQGSVRQFESHLAALKAFQPTPKVRTAVAALERAWEQCRALLSVAPSKRGAIALYDANEALQQAAHSAGLAYKDAAGATADRSTSVAGRQHMLLQRMAKFYFYRTWELYDAPADMELHLSRAHFTAVLNQIERSPLASAQVKARAPSSWPARYRSPSTCPLFPTGCSSRRAGSSGLRRRPGAGYRQCPNAIGNTAVPAGRHGAGPHSATSTRREDTPNTQLSAIPAETASFVSTSGLFS
jgi:quinol monooxygenase YgiN